MSHAIRTVGHSSRSAEELVAILRAHRVGRLVDVRRHPGSRRHPHFSRSALEQTLSEAGIVYVHEPDLGGRRRALEDSPNTAWRNDQFRGYADHMASEAFQAALGRMTEQARRQIVAVMCAEAYFARCHRRLIADALCARGWDVFHVIDAERAEPHRLHPQVHVLDGGHVIYPGDDQLGLFDDDET